MSTKFPSWLPWSYALRAVVAVLLGIFLVIAPGVALATFIMLFAAYSIADGIFAIAGAFRRPDDMGIDWIMVLWGVVAIAVGILFLLFPGISLTVFVLIVAAWMLVMGIAIFGSAATWRRMIAYPWAPIVLAIFSILFGIYLFMFPLAGVAAIPFTFGAFVFLWGALLLFVAYELWSRRDHSAEPTE